MSGGYSNGLMLGFLSKLKYLNGHIIVGLMDTWYVTLFGTESSLILTRQSLKMLENSWNLWG